MSQYEIKSSRQGLYTVHKDGGRDFAKISNDGKGTWILNKTHRGQSGHLEVTEPRWDMNVTAILHDNAKLIEVIAGLDK